LKHHRGAAVAGRDVVDARIADVNVAGGGRFQTGDEPQQRRLAAAGGADEHHELAVFDS